jgi:hypothetical protein
MSGLLQVEATDRFPGESLLQTLAMAVIRAFEWLNRRWPDGIPGYPVLPIANGRVDARVGNGNCPLVAQLPTRGR